MRIFADNERLNYTGRIDWKNPKEPVFVFPCTSVQMNFTGNQLHVILENHNEYWINYMGYILDGEQKRLLLPNEETVELEILVKENETNEHSILLFKRQDSCHEVVFKGFEIGDEEMILHPEEKPARKIEVYGDAYIICITTLLEHDSSWDCSIDQVVTELGDKKISHYLFKRNGKGTRGHLRIPEAEEMADELAAYIEEKMKTNDMWSSIDL